MLSTITNLFLPFSARFQTLGSLCPSTTVSEQEDSATPNQVRVTPKTKGAEGPARFGELPHHHHTLRVKTCKLGSHMSAGKMGCGSENARTHAFTRQLAVEGPSRALSNEAMYNPVVCPASDMGMRAVEEQRGITGTARQSERGRMNQRRDVCITTHVVYGYSDSVMFVYAQQ